MAVPKQVADQIEAARQAQEQLSTGASNPDPEPQVEDQGQTPPASAPTVNDEWQHKYKTLQGMFNAQVGKLQQELRQAREEAERLKTAPVPQSPPPAQPTQAFVAEKYVTDKDEADFGADTIDLIRRAAREEFAGQLAAERDRVANLEAALRTLQTDVIPKVEKVASTQQITVEQAFWRDLSAAVPEWQAINDDPDFHQWLLEVDPLTGASRQDYLESAQSQFDVNRVSKFFTTWKANAAPAKVEPPKKPASTELEKMIAPGRGRGGDPPTQEKKTYTRDEIAKFYDDVRSGKFSGREQEKSQIERDIFLASQEGRVN
jgi:hypothetical protein